MAEEDAQAPSAQSSASSAPTSQQPPKASAPDERTVIDAAADLLQTIVDWLRQEAEAAVKQKVVLPLQRLGFTIAAAQLAVALAIVGLIFIAIGSLLLLADWIGWPGALYAIGGTFVIVALVFAFFSGRMRQK
jgi:hypothetical protein